MNILIILLSFAFAWGTYKLTGEWWVIPIWIGIGAAYLFIKAYLRNKA